MLGAGLRSCTKGAREKIAHVLSRLISDPNHLTFCSLVLAMGFIPAHLFGYRVPAFVLMLSAYLVDVFDGAVARILGKESKWGNYLDAMVDKYVEAFIYIGLGFTNHFPALLAALGSLIESYAKPRTALVVPIDNRDWPAIGERVERCAVIAMGYAVYTFFALPNAFLDYILYVVAVMTWIGSIQRVLFAKKIIEQGGLH